MALSGPKSDLVSHVCRHGSARVPGPTLPAAHVWKRTTSIRSTFNDLLHHWSPAFRSRAFNNGSRDPPLRGHNFKAVLSSSRPRPATLEQHPSFFIWSPAGGHGHLLRSSPQLPVPPLRCMFDCFALIGQLRPLRIPVSSHIDLSTAKQSKKRCLQQFFERYRCPY